MRTITAGLVVGWFVLAAVEGCSSSSPAGGQPEDAGKDATSHAEGGGTDATADSGTDGTTSSDTGSGTEDSTAPEEAGDSAAPPEAAADAGQDSPNEATPEGGGDAGPDTGTVDCGSTPSLHVDEAGTIYCGFATSGDLLCATGQECCLGGYLEAGTFAPQECAGFGVTCTNGTVGNDAGAPPIPVECAQIADCTANGVVHAVACCLQGATAPADGTCSYPKATLGTAVVCESSDAGATTAQPCATGEVQICSSNTDCPTGKTCTPGKWKILDVGFCL